MKPTIRCHGLVFLVIGGTGRDPYPADGDAPLPVTLGSVRFFTFDLPGPIHRGMLALIYCLIPGTKETFGVPG